MRLPFAWAFIAALLLLGGRYAHAAPCVPSEVTGGTGSSIMVGSKGGGVFAYAFCVDAYSVRPLYLYAPWSALTPSVLADIQAARESVESFTAQVAKVAGRQCVIEGKELMVEAEAAPTHWELCSAMHDDMLAHWPPEPAWQVVPSASGSRPMYPVVDGVRSTTAVPSPRAANNAACSCTAATAIAAGRYRYCPVPPHAANLVAYCGRTQ
jgi:hypothetical protein